MLSHPSQVVAGGVATAAADVNPLEFLCNDSLCHVIRWCSVLALFSLRATCAHMRAMIPQQAKSLLEQVAAQAKTLPCQMIGAFTMNGLVCLCGQLPEVPVRFHDQMIEVLQDFGHGGMSMDALRLLLVAFGYEENRPAEYQTIVERVLYTAACYSRHNERFCSVLRMRHARWALEFVSKRHTLKSWKRMQRYEHHPDDEVLDPDYVPPKNDDNSDDDYPLGVIIRFLNEGVWEWFENLEAWMDSLEEDCDEEQLKELFGIKRCDCRKCDSTCPSIALFNKAREKVARQVLGSPFDVKRRRIFRDNFNPPRTDVVRMIEACITKVAHEIADAVKYECGCGKDELNRATFEAWRRKALANPHAELRRLGFEVMEGRTELDAEERNRSLGM